MRRSVALIALMVMLAGCGTPESPEPTVPAADVTATYEAARAEILNRSRSAATRPAQTEPTPTTVVDPTATTDGSAEPTPTATPHPAYDLDAVPEMPAPEQIKQLAMPTSEVDIQAVLDRLPDSLGSNRRAVIAGIHDGSNGMYGASYADNTQNPPTFMDVYFTHNPTLAASPNINDRYKNPDWLPTDDAAQGVAYALSDDVPADLVAELRIVSVTGGRDGELYWLQMTMEHGISLQWAYRGSEWGFAVSGNDQESLDVMVAAMASAVSGS